MSEALGETAGLIVGAVSTPSVQAGSVLRRKADLEGIPAALIAACEECRVQGRRSVLREFDGRALCSTCFTEVLNAAEVAMRAMRTHLTEPDRLCSRCAAMVDPSVGSQWCSVLELGDGRAAICENFVPAALRLKAATEPPPSDPMTSEALWRAVSEELSHSLGPTHLVWLLDTKAESFSDGCLRIEAPDEYTRAWLLARLMPAIMEALEASGYPDVTVDVSVGPSAPKPGHVQSSRPSGRQAPALRLQPTPPPRSPSRHPSPHEPGGFNPAFTFEQFVVGTGNRLAHAAALEVAEGKAGSFNPLFIHGAVGVGKTHLLQAIGGRCAQQGRAALYVASETFTNELIAAIRGGSTADFRRRYRRIDILLVDDIHFIIGKESTQEEFFHTFNWLYDGGKQIVLSSDRPPNEMTILDERLRSRFWWGLTADMQPPDLETRIEILRNKALLRGRKLPEDLLTFLAGRATNSVREIEGLLNRLLALADLHGIEPSMSLAASLAHPQDRQREIDHNDVLQAVSAYFRVAPSAMSGRQRSRNVSVPRHIAMYLMREDARLSLPRIGAVLGGRDHSTVIYGCDKVGKEMAGKGRTRRDVEAIRGLLAHS